MHTDFNVLFEGIFQDYQQRALALFNQVKPRVKEDGSAITQLDLETSRTLIDLFKRETPDYGIVSEEEPEPYRPEAPWQWIIDPVDGTASFARGYPAWGLGVGLAHLGEPVMGFMAFPALGENYLCDQTCLLRNGQPAPRADTGDVADTRNILMGSTLHRDLPLQGLKDYKLRNYGTTIYHLLCLALGRGEGMITDRCHIWDLAAGLPFTRRQGYVERYIDGSEFSMPALLARKAEKYRLPQPMVLGPEPLVAELLHQLQG